MLVKVLGDEGIKVLIKKAKLLQCLVCYTFNIRILNDVIICLLNITFGALSHEIADAALSRCGLICTQ